MEIIHRLERGLSAALGDEDYYDVNDTLDNPIPPTFLPYLPKGQFEPQIPPGTTLQPTERPSGSPGTPGRLPGLPSGPPGQPGRLPGLPSGPPGAPPRERGARGLQGQGSLGPPGPQPFTGTLTVVAHHHYACMTTYYNKIIVSVALSHPLTLQIQLLFQMVCCILKRKGKN